MKKFLGFVIGMFFILSFLTSIFRSCTTTETYAPHIDDDFVEIDSVNVGLKHHRTWLDYYSNNTYSVNYETTSSEEDAAKYDRDAFQVGKWQTDDEFWRQIYYDLYDKNRNRLNFIQDSLLFVRDSLNLKHGDFARMVVSFVQDIPYNYILPEGCEGFTNHPCVPNIKYGIYSPVEFLHRLQGDCDTRTVLLFTMLKNFGYNPVIVNSNEYMHSMLALDIPTSGDYLTFRGRRYAFWETTNVGWLPGMLPPDMSNKLYWNILLY